MRHFFRFEIPESPDEMLHGGGSAESQNWASEFYSIWSPGQDDIADTHADWIKSFREYGCELLSEIFRRIQEEILASGFSDEIQGFMLNELRIALAECRVAYDKACDELERGHQEAGTLDEVLS